MSSPRVDYTDLRYRYAKPAGLFTYKNIRKIGLMNLTALQKYDAKRAEEFADTGHFSKPLPASFVKKIQANDNWIASYVTGRLVSLKSDEGNLSPITFKEIALLRYVLNEKKRAEALQKIIDFAERENGQKTFFDLIDNPEIAGKKDLLKSAIRVGLEFNIPAPLEKFTADMKAEDHLKFLKASVASQGMTPHLRRHFDLVETKVEFRKSAKATSEMNQQLSMLETNPYNKEMLFNKAIEKTLAIRSRDLRAKRLQQLRNTVLAGGDKKNPYEMFREDSRLTEQPHKKKLSPAQKALGKAKALPMAQFMEKISGYASVTLRIQGWKMLFNETDNLALQKEFFAQAANEIKLLKTEKARASNFISLRDIAPIEEYKTRTHALFLENAPYEMLLEDTLSYAAGGVDDLVMCSMKQLYEHKNDNPKNRQLYAFNDIALRQAVGPIGLAHPQYNP